MQVKRFVFNAFQENTYILYKGQEAIVLDPGFNSAEEERQFWDFLTAEGLRVRHVLLTHTHLDHIFGLHAVVQRTNCLPHFHVEDKVIWDMASVMASEYQQTIDPYRGPVTFIDTHAQFTGFEDMQILFTPGHSPGSLSFYFPNERLVFVGDVLFKGSVGTTAVPLADFAVLEHSIRKVLYALPEATSVYSGHGAPTDIGTEKRSNPFVRAETTA